MYNFIFILLFEIIMFILKHEVESLATPKGHAKQVKDPGMFTQTLFPAGQVCVPREHSSSSEICYAKMLSLERLN